MRSRQGSHAFARFSEIVGAVLIAASLGIAVVYQTYKDAEYVGGAGLLLIVLGIVLDL